MSIKRNKFILILLLLFLNNIKAQENSNTKLKVFVDGEIPNFKYYYFESGADLSIRIARGLFVEFGFEADKINDQFYLPVSEISDEDILLDVRKLPTSYEISGKFGIKYQLGQYLIVL